MSHRFDAGGPIGQFNPGMVPDALPEDFEELSVPHDHLEASFGRFLVAEDATPIDPGDSHALEREGTLRLFFDEVFRPFEESADRFVPAISGTWKRAEDGAVFMLTDPVDSFYSVVPNFGDLNDPDCERTYERLQHSARVLVGYLEDRENPATGESNPAFLMTLVLTNEAFEEMAEKIEIISNYLNSSLKVGENSLRDIPVRSVLFERLTENIEERLKERSERLPDGREYRLRDFVDTQRADTNFFEHDLLVDVIEKQGDREVILDTRLETHRNYAGVSSSNFLVTKWLSEIDAGSIRSEAA